MWYEKKKRKRCKVVMRKEEKEHSYMYSNFLMRVQNGDAAYSQSLGQKRKVCLPKVN